MEDCIIVGAGAEAREFHARTVLMATGVISNRPAGIDDALHAEALAEGLLRYCPICDGFEVTDKRVAVIGTGSHGAAEAIFLRGYTADLTLISPEAEHELDAQCTAQLDEARIERIDDCLVVDSHQRTNIPGLFAPGMWSKASTRSATRWAKAV